MESRVELGMAGKVVGRCAAYDSSTCRVSLALTNTTLIIYPMLPKLALDPSFSLLVSLIACSVKAKTGRNRRSLRVHTYDDNIALAVHCGGHAFCVHSFDVTGGLERLGRLVGSWSLGKAFKFGTQRESEAYGGSFCIESVCGCFRVAQ